MKWNIFFKNRGISSYIYCTIDDFKKKKKYSIANKDCNIIWKSYQRSRASFAMSSAPSFHNNSIEIWCRCEIDPQVVSVEKEREKVVETSKGVLLCGHVTCLMDFSLADFIPPYQAIP